MKSNYIPEILKEKLSTFYKFFYSFFLLIISICIAAALFTFDINDNSFLTSTNNASNNILGDFGLILLALFFIHLGY